MKTCCGVKMLQHVTIYCFVFIAEITSIKNIIRQRGLTGFVELHKYNIHYLM